MYLTEANTFVIIDQRILSGHDNSVPIFPITFNARKFAIAAVNYVQ